MKSSNIFELLDSISLKLESIDSKLDGVNKNVKNIKERFGF